MNNVLFYQKDDPANARNSEEGVKESIYPYPHEINTANGGEFLDDAIRMKDQPLEETTAKENE